MYEKVNITENHLQVLSLFTKGFNREFYIREVQKILRISPRTAQLILDDLERKAILESTIKGKIRTYKIKKTGPAKDYFIFVEQYKKITFLEKRPMIKEIITKITPSIKGIGLIFGSYVKELEKKDSDIDIFVVGEHDRKKIKKVSDLYGTEVSVKAYPWKIFEKEIKDDILIKEVLSNHVVFSGVETFVRMVLKNG